MRKLIRFMGNRPTWAIPYIIFMAIFVVAPLFLVAYYSFVDDQGFTLRYFQKFFLQPDSVNTFIYSIGIALITTMVCILIGYPAAYFMANSKYGTPKVMAMLFILPMWINVLLRTLATVALFDYMNIPLGEGALVFGMVYNFLPFMVLPIYNALSKIDDNVIQAARDLGANGLQVFLKIISS